MSQLTLLIDCTDAKGIVHAVAGVLYAAGWNVDYQREFVDSESSRFFMRTVVSGASAEPLALTAELTKVLPADSRVTIAPYRKKDVIVFASNEPHCLAEILVSNEYDSLPLTVRAVVSNHDSLRSLVERFNIPFHHVPVNGEEREKHEQRVTEVLDDYSFDYLILAKYMRILSPTFVAAHPERIVNIHHSFLPAFIGAKPYHRAFARGVKIIGATAHFVTDDLDEGPIIAQDVTRVTHSTSVEQMIHAGSLVEKTVLVRALSAVLEDRVIVYKNRTVIFD